MSFAPPTQGASVHDLVALWRAAYAWDQARERRDAMADVTSDLRAAIAKLGAPPA